MTGINALHYCILACVEQMGADRTVYATYHLLKGKRSSQTMQDAKLYKISEYFRIFPHITREEYDEHFSYLEAHHYVELIQSQVAIITETGKQHLQQQTVPINGLLYSELSLLLWKRLVLMIQTISHLQKKENRFRPIVQDMDVKKWVKNFFLASPYPKEELAQRLYEECYQYLQTRTEQEATIFVWKLTGYKRIGLTDEQIANALAIDKYTVFFLFQSVLHGLIENIEQYSFLRKICPSIVLQSLSDSAKKTYQFLQQGFTIEKISQIRCLKQNTIEDHIVEMALNDVRISIDDFVPQDKQKEIRAVYEQMNTKKLRDLKRQLDETYTYFQIRLVLAKVESNYGN